MKEVVFNDKAIEFFKGEQKKALDNIAVTVVHKDTLKNKNKVINDLLKRISDLEFEVERLEKREKECIDHYLVQNKYASEMEDKYITEKYKNNKAIEYINEVLECNYHGANITFDVLIHNTNNILKGVDKE